LREVARRIRGELRSVDVAGRFGGEEFVVLVVQADSASAAVTAERIRAAVMASPIALGSGEIHVTISLGVAALPPDGRTGPELLAAADQALYAAKRGGRNRVERAGA
jgi:diguanylate cyclase (GGDEF)-like protein